MLDEFRNISILNHFLQNVTCSMWDISQGLRKMTPMLRVGARDLPALWVKSWTQSTWGRIPTQSMGTISESCASPVSNEKLGEICSSNRQESR